MLHAIARVCELTPKIKHWLPTREAAIVKAFLRERDIPTNLVIRMSSTMIDDAPIAGHAHTSTVHSKGKAWVGEDCRARHAAINAARVAPVGIPTFRQSLIRCISVTSGYRLTKCLAFRSLSVLNF